ncbi:MIF4G domain protein (macronuclear) [Tetrahymena thermophila SB210]|uniref:MIF4G domain protein n=1 Tax=Tetrahymena thermophila (strain SB210) TaxID=312017 RepID=I7M2P5_TETTS|nr:MIF4G domain protein [Tetrahymena thermophila SB210]EAS01052.2 MIF4G domain protein [Tetrahymena thermophila SB210]|eukprot:XP_001021297.2 MIF4G domain protein [Tetrahymena thermophila SB210]
MQKSQIVSTQPQKDQQQPIVGVVSSAPLEKKPKKALKLKPDANGQFEQQNSTNNNAQPPQQNVIINNGTPYNNNNMDINNANRPANLYPLNLNNGNIQQFQQTPPFIQTQHPNFPNQPFIQPQFGYPQHNQPIQPQFPNQNNKIAYKQKMQQQTYLTTQTNAATPQNTPQTLKNQQQVFQYQQPDLFYQLGQLVQPTADNQKPQHPMQKNNIQQPHNSTYGAYQHNYKQEQSRPNQGYKQNIQQNKQVGNFNNYESQEIQNDQVEEEIQKQYQRDYEAENLKKQEEQEEKERLRREEEEKLRLKEEEDERQRKLEEERIQEQKRLERLEEEKRLAEQRKILEDQERERQAKLLEERKRPTFEKISYYLNAICNKTIEITYEQEVDDELKSAVELFEERKIAIENSTKNERTSNVPTNIRKSEQSTSSSIRSNQAFPMNNNSAISRREIDPDELALKQSAERDWLKQQNQVNEEQQKLKDIKRLTNILTYDNIEKVKAEFFKYAQDNNPCLENSSTICKEVIAKIMEKAITEMKYTALYGQLCKYLNDELKKNIDSKDKKNPDTQDNVFRNNFLNLIQSKFENITQVLQSKKKLVDMTEEERKDFHTQRKKRIILLVKFIGELFILNVINKHVIKIVISEFLQKHFTYKDIEKLKETDEKYVHYDDFIQGIIELYEITGPSLDNLKKDSKVEQRIIIDEIKKQITDTKTISKDYFAKFEAIGFQDMMSILETYKNCGNVSPIIKALIQNLIERRDKNWQERLFQKEKPKTKQEIKEEHEKDLQQRAEEVQIFSQQTKGNYSYSQPRSINQPIVKKQMGRGYANLTQNKKEGAEIDEVDEDEQESQKKNTDQNYKELFGIMPSQPQPQAKAAAKEFIDYESRVKEIYQNLEDLEQSQKHIEEILSEDKKKVLTYLIILSYTEKKEQNLKRTNFLNSLIKKKLFTPDDVISILNQVFSTAQKEACDYPDVYKCLSLIIESLMDNFADQFNLEKIQISLTGDEDDDYDILYFFEELFRELVKSLKERGDNLDPVKVSIKNIYQNAKLAENQIQEQISKFF